VSPSAKSLAKAPAKQPALRYAFPVDGKVSYSRSHLKYPASDIIAKCGSNVRSPVNGVVLELSRVDRFDPTKPDGAAKGGLFVSILGADGVRYYSSHFSTIVPALAPGAAVRPGAVIGKVGRTGNAHNICHVHFGISPPCRRIGDWWIRRGVLYPWASLDSWRAGGQRSPAADVAAWQRTNGCRDRLPTD
jgi:murein DD-endopeptidase MepM/ murein hydrolase activator NlpD